MNNDVYKRSWHGRKWPIQKKIVKNKIRWVVEQEAPSLAARGEGSAGSMGRAVLWNQAANLTHRLFKDKLEPVAPHHYKRTAPSKGQPAPGMRSHEGIHPNPAGFPNPPSGMKVHRCEKKNTNKSCTGFLASHEGPIKDGSLQNNGFMTNIAFEGSLKVWIKMSR